MAINLNDNFKINVGKPIDSKYLSSGNTAYTSTGSTNLTIPISERYRGLTVNINGVEYWYKDGVTNTDLVEKKTGSDLPVGDFVTGATNLGFFSGKTGVQTLPLNHLLSVDYDGNYASLYNYFYRGADGIIYIGTPSDGIPKRGYVKTSEYVKSFLWNEYTGNADLVGWILIDGNIADQLGTFQYSAVPSYYDGITKFPYTGNSWTTGSAYNNGSNLVVDTVVGSLTTGNTVTIGGPVYADLVDNKLEFRTIYSKTPEIIAISSDSSFIYLSGNTGTGKVTGATNGLKTTGDKKVGLGGTLTGNTTIDGANINNLQFTNINQFQVTTSGSSTSFSLDCNNILMGVRTESICMAGSGGLKYGANYSASYDDRSLVDKGYIAGLITTGNNGIVKTGVNFHLGGTLTGNTTISGLNTHGLSLNCLSSFNVGFNGASIITDYGNVGGLKYAADYSNHFTERSIPDVAYVSAVASGLRPKEAVNVATTTSLPYPYTGLTTIDGVMVQNGWRVLVKDEVGSPQFNGVWIASSGVWTRATDFDGIPVSGETTSGTYMWVLTGNTNQNTAWVLTTPDPIYIGSTALNFTLFTLTIDVLSEPNSGIDITMCSGAHYIALDDLGKCVRLNAITGGTNGITNYDGRNLCLGGTLSSDVDINLNTGFTLQLGTFCSGGQLSVGNYAASPSDDNICMLYCNPISDYMGALSICSNATTYFQSYSTGASKQMYFDYTNALQYGSDYSSSYTNRTLVDKGYVDSKISCCAATGTTVNNGLTRIGSNIKLGGTLTGTTTINMSGNSFQICNGTNSGLILNTNCAKLIGDGKSITLNNTSLQLSSGIGNNFTMSSGGTVYGSTGSTGICYDGDYSSNFTNRTLVDKEFVVNAIIASGTTGIGGGNGLGRVGNNITLGGTLTGNTTINGNNSYGLLISTDTTEAGNYAKFCVNKTGTLPSTTLCTTDTTYGGVYLTLSGISATIGNTGYGFGGFKYNNDNSSYFTKRSLPDVAYVTGLTTTSGVQSANNGLTKTGSNIRLGGALTGNTTITGAYTLNICGGAQLNTTCGYQISGNTVFRLSPNSARAIFIGCGAGNDTMTGCYNLAVGNLTLGSTTTGSNNTAIGNQAMRNNTIGDNNVAIGRCVMFSNVCGTDNVAFGYQALYNNSCGCGNVANGYKALFNNLSGTHNLANGYNALYANTTGCNNVAYGLCAGFNALGCGNVFLGANAGFNENGSNKLYIENSNTINPLIYGEFDTNCVIVHGAFKTSGATSLLVAPVSGTSADQILVWNSSDKVIKKVTQASTQNVVNVCNVSSNYTTTASDSFVGVSVASTICLYNSPALGQKVTIADIGSCALTNPIIICSPLGINGQPFSTINTDYGSITFIYNGTFWGAVAFVN
jgi:hypothetical protein